MDTGCIIAAIDWFNFILDHRAETGWGEGRQPVVVSGE